jgi:hypothetical protein
LEELAAQNATYRRHSISQTELAMNVTRLEFYCVQIVSQRWDQVVQNYMILDLISEFHDFLLKGMPSQAVQ